MSAAGNPIKDLISGGLDGILSGASNIIEKFKADPTKVVEVQADIEKLKIQAAQTSEQITVQIEQEKTKQLEAQEKEISARWGSDMSSDNWLSKNARPLVMLSLLVFLYIIIVFDSTGINFEVKPAYIDLMESLLITVTVAYFGSRGFEKYHSLKRK